MLTTGLVVIDIVREHGACLPYVLVSTVQYSITLICSLIDRFVPYLFRFACLDVQVLRPRGDAIPVVVAHYTNTAWIPNMSWLRFSMCLVWEDEERHVIWDKEWGGGTVGGGQARGGEMWCRLGAQAGGVSVVLHSWDICLAVRSSE